MTKIDTVKAWRNPAYRATLESAPENPAGMIELAGTDLESVAGGYGYGGGCGGGCGTRKSCKTKKSSKSKKSCKTKKSHKSKGCCC